MQLNDQQRAIVNTDGGEIAVVAGAGSGKSTTNIELIAKLHTQNEIPLEKMFISTFTNAAGRDLKEKLKNKLNLSEENLNKLWIGTFHSLGYRYLTQIRKIKLEIILPIEANYYLRNIYKQIIKNEGVDEGLVPFIEVIGGMEKYRNENCTWKKASSHPDISRLVYEMYQLEKQKMDMVDYTDILDMFSEKLKDDAPFTTRFNWVFVDENQDNNAVQNLIADQLFNKNRVLIGDPKQCWWENELIPVMCNGVEKNVKAADVKVGDKVRSLRGHRLIEYFPVTFKENSEDTKKYIITTESNKKITVSKNHLFFLKKSYEISCYVYLMYHKDFGFRVGRYSVSLRHRAVIEHAKRMWVLRVCKDLDEALYYEKKYSLEYTLIQTPFVHRPQTMSLDKTKLLFKEFGKKDIQRLFEDFDFDFNYPHYFSEQSDIRHLNQIIRVKLVRLSEKRKLKNTSLYEVEIGSRNTTLLQVVKTGGLKNRKLFKNYKEAYSFALNLVDFLIKNKYEAIYVESLYFERQPYYLDRAKNILLGMSTLVENSGVVTSEKIIKVEEKEEITKFVSLEVAETGLISNQSGIISHNSIYAFRGAAPHIFKEKIESAAKVYNLSYNYRSSKEIIEFANSLLTQIPAFKGQNLIPTKNSCGKPVFTLSNDSAFQIFKSIQKNIRNGIPLEEIAVLGRSIKPLMFQNLQVMLRRNNIPYTIRGGDDKLNASFIQNYLSVLKSVLKPTKVSLVNSLGLLPSIGPKTAMKLAESVVAAKGSFDALEQASGKYTKTKAFYDYFKLQDISYDNKELLLRTLDFIYNHHLVPKYGKNDPMDPSNKKAMIFDVLYEYLMGYENLMEGIDSLYINEEDLESEKGKIIISTIHRSKGLEWESVHIANFNENSIPYLRPEDEGDAAREEEEFCIAYVAITRAKKHLHMYMSFMNGTHHNARVNKLSRFLKETYKSSKENYFTFQILDVQSESLYKARLYNKLTSNI